MASLCEDLHAIDLAWLTRRKLLRPGVSTSIRWSRAGCSTGSIRIKVGADAVEFAYRGRRMGEEWQDLLEVVPFTETATAFGGRRRWFACPRCGKPCRVLYGGARFLCRRCHGLRYGSQYELDWHRALRRAQGIRIRLGGSANVLEPFPPRPKHMQLRTYGRLRLLDARLLARSTAGLARRLALIGR